MITVARRILRLSRSKLHAKRLQIGINSTVKRPNYRNKVVTVGVFLVIWIYVSKRKLNYRLQRFFRFTFRNVNRVYVSKRKSKLRGKHLQLQPYYGNLAVLRSNLCQFEAVLHVILTAKATASNGKHALHPPRTTASFTNIRMDQFVL